MVSWLETTAVRVSIRPEKLHLTSTEEARLQGRIHTRLFLGNHWRYQIHSPAGRLLMTRQNAGRDDVGEGESVGLTWDSSQVRVMRQEQHDG